MDKTKKESKKKLKSERKISGYYLYSKERREALSKIGEKITIRVLAEEWSGLLEKDKKKYLENAEKINNENLENQKEDDLENSISIDNINNLSTSNIKIKLNEKNLRKYKDEKFKKYMSENGKKRLVKNKIINDDSFLSNSEEETQESKIKESKNVIQSNNQKNMMKNNKKLKSDNISKSKILQEGFIYKKERQKNIKILRLCVELCSS